jgi:spore coat polysaccharide biosynthesis predicted glycosyltransferase SpsG
LVDSISLLSGDDHCTAAVNYRLALPSAKEIRHLNLATRLAKIVLFKNEPLSLVCLSKVIRAHPELALLQIGMAAHMSACDVALGAPGGATWERACLGLPSLYFAVSQNQVSKLKYLETAGFCLYGGEARSLEKMEFLSAIGRFLSDPSRLVQMREVGMKAVDGLGASRVADLFNLLF